MPRTVKSKSKEQEKRGGRGTDGQQTQIISEGAHASSCYRATAQLNGLHFSSQGAAQCPFPDQGELVDIYPELFARVYTTVETSESRIIQKYIGAVEYMGCQSRKFKEKYNIIYFIIYHLF